MAVIDAYVKVKRLEAGAIIPKLQTEGASGFDLHSLEDFVIKPDNWGCIRTGLAFEIPEGFEGQIRGRSGMAAKHGIGITQGIGTIDADYRGEVKVILVNHSCFPVTIAKGDRIAQMIIAPVPRVALYEVDELLPTARGAGGFGSTGTR